MERTSLSDNLNSEFLAALSALLPKQANQRVLVYVESDEDIAFWEQALSPFRNNQIDFDIQLPIRTNLEKGKNAALEKSKEMLNLNVGTHLIVCVDSDYDYLLQQTTEKSRKINNSQFIFQTYTYSIENFFCWSSSLHSLCVQATKNNNKIIDFENLMQVYSELIYELFLWNLYFRIKGDTTSFNLSTFCDTVKILEQGDARNQFKAVILNLKDRINNKLQELKGNFSDDIVAVKTLGNQLEQLSLNKQNAYLFAQGHLIKKNVVLMFLGPVCNVLRGEKVQEIKDSAHHAEEIENNINLYKKNCSKIEDIVRNSTVYTNCFLYEKIQNDLKNYIENLNSTIVTFT